MAILDMYHKGRKKCLESIPTCNRGGTAPGHILLAAVYSLEICLS